MRTIVMIPGLGSDMAVWARTIAALSDDALCRVGDTLQDDSFESMARRILADAPERFVLAGVSMGGMVAMQIMRLAPERVSALSLIGTKARPDTEEEKARRRAINAVIEKAADMRGLSGGSLNMLVHDNASDEVRAELTEMGVRVGPQTYVRQNTAAMNRSDARPTLAAITVPTQVISGEFDRMSTLAHAHEIHAAIPGSDLHIIPDCGHLPPIETPEIMAGFLRDLIAKAATGDGH